MMQGKPEDAAFDYNRERVQQSLSLIYHLVEALMKGKKITLPGISPIPWEPCTLFNSGKNDASPAKDREESEAINNAKRASNSKYKTLPCKWFHSGLGCERGDNCDYIHDYNYKGVMPPPHTYKQKKPQMMNQPRHSGSPHTTLGGLTSLQGQMGQGQQIPYMQSKMGQNHKPLAGKPENGHGSLMPNNGRGYGNRQGGQGQNEVRGDSRSKSDYRQRNYDDYRRPSYRQDDESEQKRDQQFYDDDRRQKWMDTEANSEEGKAEDEDEEEENATEKRAAMNEEEVAKEETPQEENLENPEKSKTELEEGQVSREVEGKYYNNYGQKGKRNFDNRDYYNTNYRRDYVNKRGYSDPYYDDYGGDGYSEQGYGYYGDRGYYGNYYYGRHRNYRHGYYDQGWNRGRGGWRNNGYRYDDYEDDYYDEEAPNGMTHLPDNPYDEDGQEEDEGQSEREEGEVRDEVTGQEEQEETAVENAEEREKKANVEKEETPEGLEEGQVPQEAVPTIAATTRSTAEGLEGQDETPEGKEVQKPKEHESEEDGEVHKKERGKRDQNRRDRNDKEKFDRGERHDRFNNSGRYGPFGGKSRYNKNFNYNNGFFGNQGEQLPMQMMYNIPFMNMMNSNFDLNTMMHFANNFQQYAHVQKPHQMQGYDQEKFYKGNPEGGYGQGQYPRKENAAMQNELAPLISNEQVSKQPDLDLEPGQVHPSKIEQLPAKERSKETTPERPNRSQQRKSPIRRPDDMVLPPENQTLEFEKEPIEKTKPEKEKAKSQDDKPEDEGDDDEEDGNDYGEEEQKEDEKNDNSYQDEQNDEENYEDHGYYQYNDYRYRNNRDYDHRSAHYHQQQRMKFFNQQFIETLKKYPPDVFKCTFPQFFGMGGNPNIANQGQGGSGNFGNMANIPFMSYMMSQFLNQNIGGHGVNNHQFNMPYHSNGQHYNQGQGQPGQYSKQSEGSPNVGIPYNPSMEEPISQRALDQHFRDEPEGQSSRPGFRESGQQGFYQGYDPAQNHQMMMNSMQFPQQNVFNEFLNFNQGYRGGHGPHGHHSKNDSFGQPSSHQQFNIEQDFVVKDATGGLTSPVKTSPAQYLDNINAESQISHRVDVDTRPSPQKPSMESSEQRRELEFPQANLYESFNMSHSVAERPGNEGPMDQSHHSQIQNELDMRPEPASEAKSSQNQDFDSVSQQPKSHSSSKSKQKQTSAAESRSEPPVLRRSSRKKGK